MVQVLTFSTGKQAWCMRNCKKQGILLYICVDSSKHLTMIPFVKDYFSLSHIFSKNTRKNPKSKQP